MCHMSEETTQSPMSSWLFCCCISYAATRLVLSGNRQTPRSTPQKQILPESGKQKILSPVFQILLFDPSNPNDAKNRLAFSWTATRLAARQLFGPISSFWVFRILSCFSWLQFSLLENIWATRHMLCLRLWCDDPRRPMRA